MTDAERRIMKVQRLALIKERYRKLILEPRREIEMELHAPDSMSPDEALPCDDAI